MVRSGLSSRSEARPDEPRELFDRVRALADALRPACVATADIVVGDDEVDADFVLTAIAGLKRDCDRPTRVALGATADPVPLANIHFCGCQAAEPPRYCSAPELHLRSWRIDTRRVTRVLGEDSCTHGAASFLQTGQSEGMGRRPPNDAQSHDSVSSALDVLAQPHAGLPPCRDAVVGFDGAWTWGQMRPVLREVADRLPQRITVTRTVPSVYAPGTEPPASGPGIVRIGPVRRFPPPRLGL